MMRSFARKELLAICTLTWAMGCGGVGKVDQGRVIAFDKEKGTVTFIRDLSTQRDKPDYSFLPPVTYEIPKDPGEMGPAPKAGQRMQLDIPGRQIAIFDSATQNFKIIPYTLVEKKENVVKEDPLVAGKEFPVVDSAGKTITIYSGRQKVLVTFRLPAEYFELPPCTWAAGDEVRVYYREPGKALRLMNISQTDIFKK
jgi:Domain of unknown function (DUF4881)